eukprot:511528_1
MPLAPSVSPSLTPTIPPSLAPSLVPSVSPSLIPTMPPSLAPSVSPSLTPTIPPSLAPSLVPSVSPSLIPTMPPSLAPSVSPSFSPSNIPSISPTVAPTVPPTNFPSLAPSNAPSIIPSLSPTSPPTLYPTTSPTYCYDAKFRAKMFMNNWLWSDEKHDILVSNNCECKLKLHRNGNLIIHKYIQKKRLAANYWVNVWETNTSRFNFSGVSVAKFGFNSQAFLVINEYAYKGVQSINEIQLWENSESINKNLNGNILDNIALVLLNECCLEVIDLNNEIYDILWTNCVETTEIPIITTQLTNDMSLDSEQSSLKNAKDGQLRWLWISIVIILLLVILLMFYCYKSNNKINDQLWISSKSVVKEMIETNNIVNKHEWIECEQETDQIEKWMKE